MYRFNRRKIVLLIADFGMIGVCGVLAQFCVALLQINLHATDRNIALVSFVTAVLCVMALWITGAYAKLWRHAAKADYNRCFYGVAIGTVLAAIFMTAFGRKMQIGFWLVYFLGSCIATTLFRLLFRRAFLREETEEDGDYTRVMIIGAGQAAKILLSDIERAQSDKSHPAYHFKAVCIVDDDYSIGGTFIQGVRVMGTTTEIKEICERERIDMIIFAIPSCEEANRVRILNICNETALPLKVLPFISQLVLGDEPEQQNLLSQVKDISMEALLGREPISFDKDDISQLIRGKVCMVTGGGGSIGSELVRQIASYAPAQVIIVDIYENNAYEIQQELVMQYGDKLNLVTLIASVRDYPRMSEVFRTYRPDLVFHAAAHKHVPLMEHSPMEAIKNNIIGTFNVATLADFYHTEKFVMISTDKAVNPTNVMGASKRCCEMIAQYMAQCKTNTEFITTRFGNVLGSHGSVIPLFKKQIESGQPVTVTHPDIIRYFMTIPEAVSLVLQAGAMAHGGEIFVLDMGEPVKITQLAENLIRMYGKVPYKEVPILFTGLRPGEKLFEELLMDEEGLEQTANKKIFIGNQIEIEPISFMQKLHDLRDAAATNDAEETIALLAELVPTFAHEPMELHDEPVKVDVHDPVLV